MAARHYAEHDGKPFFDNLVTFITRSPVLVMVVEGPEGTYRVVRNLMGATNPAEAAAGTIRGDLALVMSENLVHGSDSPESAQAGDRDLLSRAELSPMRPGAGADPLAWRTGQA